MSSYAFLRDEYQAVNISQILQRVESIDESLRIMAGRPTWEEEHPSYDLEGESE